MTALLRDASPALRAALASNAPLWKADLFTFTLIDGTVLRYTSFDSDLEHGGETFRSRAPWIQRSTWKVTNTLEVPEMKVTAHALHDGFAGGADLQSQIHAGLFDGAAFLCEVAYMATPGDTAELGPLPLFGGKAGTIDCDGITATISCKGRVNDLDQHAPRNLYQIPCNLAFCDPRCGLDRADFTEAFTVGAGASEAYLPWTSAPANPGNFQGGTLVMTSGPASGGRRTIAAADTGGVTLSYPLYAAPEAGDTFTAFQGCDKSFDSGSGQSCTARGNTANYRGFEFVPPPIATV